MALDGVWRGEMASGALGWCALATHEKNSAHAMASIIHDA
jgi:hypothetical protein